MQSKVPGNRGGEDQFDLKIKGNFGEKGGQTSSGGRQAGWKGNPPVCSSLSQGRGISWRNREMIDVVGGSMAKWLVEDRAGNLREGAMSPACRSRLEDRNSSDLARVSFRTAGPLVTLRPGSVQGVNSQAF